MPSSTIDIANRALTKLGSARILSLTDDTKAGRVMNSMFAQVRDAELRRNYWNFALKRASLVALSEAPEWGYAYQYPLPADFLTLVQVGETYVRPNTKDKGNWHIESTDTGGRVIVTDMAAPLRIRYVKRVENSGFFDPLFVEVLAARLAFEACESLTQSGPKKQAASEEYKGALSEAARCNAIENPPDEFPRGSWLDAREGIENLFETFTSFSSGSSFTPTPAPTPAPTPTPAPAPAPASVYADNYADNYA